MYVFHITFARHIFLEARLSFKYFPNFLGFCTRLKVTHLVFKSSYSPGIVGFSNITIVERLEHLILSHHLLDLEWVIDALS